mgnify:CR=1 FL=1
MKLQHSIFLVPCSILFLCCCSVSHKISRQANTILLKDTAISQGHIGISIYEPATNTYWYNYNADKYFIPASNTKLFTLYAGMKYLGDSLVGMKIMENENNICLFPTADPTLLHPDFKKQPVIEYLSTSKKNLWADRGNFKAKAYGTGWAWDDYNDSYMNERSALPVFGNNVVFSGTGEAIKGIPKSVISDSSHVVLLNNNPIEYINKVERDVHQNNFTIYAGGSENKNIVVPFITSVELAFKLLADTLHKDISLPGFHPPMNMNKSKTYLIHSQPSDSLFKPMMHNSDNLFAEQTLLMVSNERLGYMSDTDMIDTLLKNDFKDIPQKPRWVDGSGLSRYNQFTPQSFIYILEKLKNEFGLERLKTILSAGGEGSLKNYFKNDSSYIFAKTGTLSNNGTLSGFLVTKKGKLLIFSILVNHYQTGAAPVRIAVEHFLQQIRKKY